MKIALVGRFGEGEILSGPERVARELFQELKNKDIDITFIEYFFSDYHDSCFIKKLFGKKVYNSGSIFRLGAFPLTLNVLRNKYDVIHFINSQRFILLFLFLRFFFKGKLITTFHGLTSIEIPPKKYFSNRNFLDFWLEKLLIKISEKLVFPSKLLFEQFNIGYKLKNQIRIIPNAVSRKFIEGRKTFPLIKEDIKIVFYNGFGSVIDRGLDVILNQLENVKYPVQLLIIGQERDLILVNPHIQVRFVSLMDQNTLINFLFDKHLIVKSITFDSFSLFAVECMTLGIIPIVHRNTGINVYIENEINGFRYENENEISELLNKIGEGKYNLEIISMNAKRIIERLNWSSVALEYLDCYRS